MSQFQPSDISRYRTFEDFFVRPLAPGARSIYEPDDPTKAVVVADSRVVVYPTVERTRALWVKGSEFTIANLIGDDDSGSDGEHYSKAWDDGAVASFRLSPQDYHRYHSPVAGVVKWFRQIPGDYFQVDPVCLHSSVNILTQNARCCVCIETEDFGDVLFVAIGATEVGTVEYAFFLFYSQTMSKMHDEDGAHKTFVDIESTNPSARPATACEKERRSASSSSGDRASSCCSRRAGSSSTRTWRS